MKHSKRLVRAVSFTIAVIMILTLFSSMAMQIAYML